MNEYKQLQQDGQAEIVIKHSRFICSLKRVDSEQDALDFIKLIKKTHYKARHNCSAYLIGENDAIQRANDDGEPSGTAGVPMLEVLKKQNLHNVVAVVTRYFGGIKLGAGGLIRAYGSSVSNALNHVGIVLHTKQLQFTLTVPYSLSSKFDYFLTQSNYMLLNTTYTEHVTYQCGILFSQEDLFKQQIIELFNGKITPTLFNETYIDLPLSLEQVVINETDFDD